MTQPLCRTAIAVLTGTLIAGGAASAASAGIWSPIESGTTQDITAIDYRGAGQLRYVTAGGQILENGSVSLSTPGVQYHDVATNPSGTETIAVGGLGATPVIRRRSGGWDQRTVPTTYSQPCTGNPAAAGSPITGALTAVTWASNTVAYVVGQAHGVVLKTVNGGATWVEISRQANGTCRAGNSSSPLTDVQAVPGTSLVTVVDNSFGARWQSSDGLATPATRQANTSVNCASTRARIAIDRSNPNRNHVVGACAGTLSFGFSEDSGATYDISMDYRGDSGTGLTGFYDVSTAGGSTIAVGNGGAIVVSPDGRTAYGQRADGGDATVDWRAVAHADASNAVVAGRNGRMLHSSAAATIPDLIAPAGTITGPVTASAGAPVTFTANVSDDPGGSGIDPAGFRWTATGVPEHTGNPVTVTFPSAGRYTVRVDFRDQAGNPGTATHSIVIGPASAPPRTPGTGTVAPGTIAPGTRTAKPTQTVKLPGGGTATITGPKTCVRPGRSFTATLKWAKAKKKGSRLIKIARTDFYIDRKRVKIDRKAPFRQTLTVKRLEPGTTHTLRARAFIKVKKGKKAPTKSLRVTFAVCSS